MTTMTATTTRPITFGITPPNPNIITALESFPTGTEVYVHTRRDGRFNVRIPGTLFTQVVNQSALNPNH